jgi:hypothetical protein
MVRICELAVRGELSGVPNLGPAEVTFDTSAPCAILETPARLAEFKTCVADAIARGHRIVLLDLTIDEFLSSLNFHAAKLREVVTASRRLRLVRP